MPELTNYTFCLFDNRNEITLRTAQTTAAPSKTVQCGVCSGKTGSSAESVGEFGVLERCSAECRELQDSPAGILRGGRAAGISQRGSPDLGLLCMVVNAAARGEVDVGTGGCCWCSTGFPAAEQHREHRAALSGKEAVVYTALRPEPPQDACEEYSQSSRAAQVFRL